MQMKHFKIINKRSAFLLKWWLVLREKDTKLW